MLSHGEHHNPELQLEGRVVCAMYFTYIPKTLLFT